MTISLKDAYIYDIECLPNVFTMDVVHLHSDQSSTWEISQYRDDRHALFEFIDHCQRNQIPWIGFNNEHYDYPVVHFLHKNRNATYQEIRAKSDAIIRPPKGVDRWAHNVWARDRLCPQIDLRKINHFDNKAKMTSLKALEINMRSENVRESKFSFDHCYQEHEIAGELIPYNKVDTKETKQFAHICMEMIEFRVGMLDRFPVDVLSWNDTKIGEKMLEQQLGDDVCYTRDPVSRRKIKRQTVRNRVPLNEIIFPYVSFKNPEFQRVLEYLKSQVLTTDEMSGSLKTKGVFTGPQATAHVGGIPFKFGTGGIHASVDRKVFTATPEFPIRDIDVKSLYPSLAIANRLFPEHLGQKFLEEYPQLLVERAKHKKGTIKNAAFKLAANGAYGKSNDKYSVFFDPKYTMTITVNGQLLLCMLAEWLLEVPTIQFIQANTDGITYQIDANYEPMAADVCRRWEYFTKLTLEDADYSRMWIRDVNNYIAEELVPAGSNKTPKLKQKGAYWHPDPANYAASISNAGPPAWHKDFNPTVVTQAAVNAMVNGIDPAVYIRFCRDPFAFMLRAKVDRASRLELNGKKIQSTTRYFVSTNGHQMVKVSPPAGNHQVGQYKRKNKLTDAYWSQINAEIGPNVWDDRIHTKNKSKYEIRHSNIQSGWLSTECNHVDDFSFHTLNYDYYIEEARKLIIS